MNRSLKEQMQELESEITAHVKRVSPDEHHNVLHHFASEYNLYDKKGQAPLWLSRVIAGIMRDVENGD